MVAVSGGVDSMVLLDLIIRQANYEVIVAHVDHGIRLESRDEARFVEAQAKRYGVPFVSKLFELGEQTSEEAARQARYDFLIDEAEKHDATLATAHHRDDLVGSIAINLLRGTGWRGLAVMNRPGILRPLLGMTKQQLYQYALKHELEWVEDASNSSDQYLRNRLRADILQLPTDTQEALGRLRNRQVELSDEIRCELDKLQLNSGGSRYFLSVIDDALAEELLRHEIAKQSGRMLQPEQVRRAILAIKTAKPGTIHDVGEGVRLTFSSDRFIVDTHL